MTLTHQWGCIPLGSSASSSKPRGWTHPFPWSDLSHRTKSKRAGEFSIHIMKKMEISDLLSTNVCFSCSPKLVLTWTIACFFFQSELGVKCIIACGPGELRLSGLTGLVKTPCSSKWWIRVPGLVSSPSPLWAGLHPCSRQACIPAPGSHKAV